MATIFTKIANGEIPSYKLAEDERYYAFLDISPLQKGHALVIPKREVDYLFDLDDKELSGLMLFAKRVAKAIEKSVPCKRIGLAVIGLEVPHAHVHLVPLQGDHDLDFSRPKLSFSPEEMADCAATIRTNL
ncbi:MAG: HIT family protein [Odoribacteraceae bacterium]|jgi:histidine triad (HIT) family protein|nr:HIT family protein [Odoribacteraceae bacterium]